MENELESLLKRVRTIYQKYGIKSITMDDVSRELGISKKTLYQYVSDKTDLVNKVIDLEIKTREECIKTACEKNLNAVEEFIEFNRLMHTMLQDYNASMDYDLRKYYPDAFARTKEVVQKKMYLKILNNLKKGITEEIYRKDLDPEFIAKLHMSRVESFMSSIFFSPEELKSKKFFTEFMIYHIRGIANTEGINILEQKIKELNNVENV